MVDVVKLEDAFDFFRENRITALALIIVNMGGVGYGYYYYYWQLSNSPLYFWPFIPDSPNSILLFVFVLALSLAGIRSRLLNVIVVVGLIKIGIWTMFIYGVYPEYYFVPEISSVSTTLLFLHLGMVIQAFTLWKSMKGGLTSRGWVVVFAWFLLNDFLDYVVGIHPLIPLESIDLVGYTTVGLNLVICILMMNRLGVLRGSANSG